MTWLVVAMLAVVLVGMTVFFIINAVAIKRDMNKRVDEFRERLEADANSIVDDLLDSTRPHQDA